MKEEMTVQAALKKAWETVNHANSGHTDKIVMFYYVSPYTPGTSGYINWFLSSKYSARNQLKKAQLERTCWHGCPPDQQFLDAVLREVYDLRERMTRAVQVASYEGHETNLDRHRASDEVNSIDASFFEQL